VTLAAAIPTHRGESAGSQTGSEDGDGSEPGPVAWMLTNSPLFYSKHYQGNCESGPSHCVLCVLRIRGHRQSSSGLSSNSRREEQMCMHVSHRAFKPKMHTPG
jgi:hypothetical protein